MTNDTNTSSNGPHSAKSSLDDLFHSARSENVPEVISHTDVNAIISPAHPAHSVPLTEKLAEFVQQHLISTPLRTGATLMTSSLLITAAILAGTGYFVAAPATHPASTAASLQTQSPVIASSPKESGQKPNASFIAKVLPSFVAPAIATPFYHDDPVIVDSLKPYDLSADQLARLGVDLEKDGTITFYREKQGSPGKVMRVSLTSDGGTNVNAGMEMPKNGLSPATTVPMLVTDRAGVRRYATIATPNSNGYTFASVLKDSSSGVKSINVNSLEVATVPGDTGKKILFVNTSTYSNDSSMHFGMRTPEFQRQIQRVLKNGQNLDLDLHSDSAKAPHMFIRRIIRSDHGTSETTVDSVMNMPKMNGHFDMDSLLKAVNTEGLNNGNRNGIIRNEINVNTTSDSNVNGNVSQSTLIERLQKSIDDARKSIRDKGMHFDMHPTTFVETPLPQNLSHLIPIRVRNLNNPSKPNEVIFWYDSIPEVTNLLPITRAGVNSKSSGITLSVYPNPTNGPATIRYELNSASDAHFALHNLLGQKLMDIGTTHGQQGDEAMDLSNLEAGVYLLITTTDSGDRNIERVVVTK